MGEIGEENCTSSIHFFLVHPVKEKSSYQKLQERLNQINKKTIDYSECDGGLFSKQVHRAAKRNAVVCNDQGWDLTSLQGKKTNGWK